MQPQWEELESVHAAITTQNIRSILPKSWLQLMQSCLSLGSSVSDAFCGVSPMQCLHCHQLAALSSFLMMGMIAKESGDTKLQEFYLEPLCQCDPPILQNMLQLLLNPCRYLRYQCRRALLCMLHVQLQQDSRTRTAQCLVDSCIRIILQQPNHSPLCQEPLQLLCTILSKQTEDVLTIETTLKCLDPHIPTLFHHFIGRSIQQGSIVCAACHCSSGTHFALHSTVLEGEAVGNNSSSETDCSSVFAVNGQNGKNLEHTKFQPNTNFEQTCYFFLRLVLKIVKCKKFVQLTKTKESYPLDSLSTLLLIPLTVKFVPLFSKKLDEQKRSYLLEKQFLEILKSFFTFSESSINYIPPSCYRDVAEVFMLAFADVQFSWMFRFEHTFIGGCHEDRQNIDYPIQKERKTEEASEYVLNRSKSIKCSPLLMSLLTVVFKSCAVFLKSAYKEEAVHACSRILHIAHQDLQLAYTEQSFVPLDFHVCSDNQKLCANHLLWLPKVFGEQDDMWIEALICLLDIFICLISRADADSRSLMTLLDPHWLFLQLLEETNFDCSLLIDWLTSPETSFLTYLTQYLKLVTRDFSPLCKAAEEWDLCSSLLQEPTAKVPDDRNLGIQCQGFDVDSSFSGLDELSSIPASSHVYGTDDTVGQALERHAELKKSAGNDSDFLPIDNNDRKKSVGLALLAGYGDCDDDDEDNDCDNGDTVIEENVITCDKDGSDALIAENVCDEKIATKRGLVAHKNSYAVMFGHSEKIIEYRKGLEESSCCVSSTISTRCSGALYLTDQQQNAAEGHFCQREETASQATEKLFVGSLDRVMHLLSDVGQRITRLFDSGLLVYNPKPLVCLIRRCESCFEKY